MMEYLVWFVGGIFFIGLIWAVLRKNKRDPQSFVTFTAAVVAAADEGERAYLTQASSLSLVPSIYAIALARFAAAMFPMSAYSVAKANGLLPPSYQNQLLERQVWSLPSGIAVKPIIEKGIEFDKDRVKDDQLFAITQFVEFFNSHDASVAMEKLAPVWKKVLSAENSISPSLQNLIDAHCAQYVTSGIVLFSRWHEEITGR